MSEDISKLYKGIITEPSFKIFLDKRYEFCKNNKLPPKKVVISQDVYFEYKNLYDMSQNNKHIQGIPYEVLEDSNIENYIKFE